MGVPAQLVAEGLMCRDHSTQQRFAGRSGVELRDDRVDQTRDLGKEPPIVPEERSQCLGHREDELAVRQVQKHFVREVFSEQQRPLLTARRTQVETLAAERPEIVVSTRGIRTPDASHTKPVVPTGQKPLAGVANAIEAEDAVLGCEPLIVDIAEPLEMPLEDRVELVVAPGDVASFRGRPGRMGGGLHTLQDGRRVRPASLCGPGAT